MKTLDLKHVILATALLMFGASVSLAGNSMKELQQRFKERYDDLRQLKDDGVIGETFDGYVAFVEKGDAEAGKLVDEENADRKELYRLIAEKENISPKKVAERNAKRNFDKAKPGDYLKGEDGEWTRKK